MEYNLPSRHVSKRLILNKLILTTGRKGPLIINYSHLRTETCDAYMLISLSLS